jgi:hypothetical protein
MTAHKEKDNMAKILHVVTDLVKLGDFARARKLIREQERHAESLERKRLSALRRSLEVDPAAWIVFAVLLVVVAAIAAATLFH